MLGDGTCADICIASIITTFRKFHRAFSLTWLALKSVYIRKEFNSHRTGLGHQHGECDMM